MADLRIERLTKSYGPRLVVDGISLEIRSGEVIGLLGRNGAGKTTTFLMIAGLVRPDGGAIYLDGRDISRLATSERARRGITYLPQEHSVFLKASVENNIRLLLELYGRSKKEREAVIREYLGEIGLLELRRQPAHTLSGGERRKLEISRALVLKPSFLLLDEPFTGIDPLTILELQKIFLNLKQKGIGIIISDHNVLDTFKIMDRAYIIDEGRVLVEGNPQAVAADEKAREKFLGKGFVLGGEVFSPPPAGRDGRPGSPPEKRGKEKSKPGA